MRRARVRVWAQSIQVHDFHPILEKRGWRLTPFCHPHAQGIGPVPGWQWPLWRPLGSIPGLPAAVWRPGSLAVCDGGGGLVWWWTELVPCSSAQPNHPRLAPPTCPTAPGSRLPWNLPLYQVVSQPASPGVGPEAAAQPTPGARCLSGTVCRLGRAASGAAVSRLPASELGQRLERGCLRAFNFC